MQLPRAILFDLDDTLISAYGRPEVAWLAVTAEFSEALARGPPPRSPPPSAPSPAASGRMWSATGSGASGSVRPGG
jgi:phosphoserine phosphatase